MGRLFWDHLVQPCHFLEKKQEVQRCGVPGSSPPQGDSIRVTQPRSWALSLWCQLPSPWMELWSSWRREPGQASFPRQQNWAGCSPNPVGPPHIPNQSLATHALDAAGTFCYFPWLPPHLLPPSPGLVCQNDIQCVQFYSSGLVHQFFGNIPVASILWISTDLSTHSRNSSYHHLPRWEVVSKPRARKECFCSTHTRLLAEPGSSLSWCEDWLSSPRQERPHSSLFQTLCYLARETDGKTLLLPPAPTPKTLV